MNFGLATVLQATSLTSLQTWQAGMPRSDPGLDNGFWATWLPDTVWWSDLVTPGHHRG
jgi:hypothetical protein